ncbi:MAG TPA: 16S rRNA (guanine(527)-N(7))-methyltransferase RsmG, partial [Clostridiales bacterium]|nr:16S rRNA (guanine(527)-N(7))-methyltransferase RsmG [Clostridiales bacterium]
MQPFIEGCAAMQIALDEQKRAAFETYLSLLLEWNQKFNLTAIREPRQIMVQHFLDSISLLQLDIIQEEDSVLDLGSGAGFPGIPIKIMLPQISLT